MHASDTSAIFSHPTYLIRRKFFKIFGASFQIYDANGQVVLYSKQQAFKLREDIRVYADEAATQEVLSIKTRSILDFGAAYDVVDSTSGEKVGALKRKGLKSLLKDEWIFMDANDRDLGLIQEDNPLLATARRFVPYGDFIPQKFVGTVDGQPVCEFRQHFNPIVQKITMDFTPDAQGRLDRRLGIAAGILLCAIEQRQD